MSPPRHRPWRQHRPTNMFLDPYLYLYALGSFSNGVFISLRGPALPELAVRVNTHTAELGAYLGFAGLSGGVFAIPTGVALDRVDAHRVFTFGLLLRAVSVGVTPLCQKLWQVNLLAVVQGATLPLIGITIRVCLVRAVGRHRTAQALNFTMGAFGLASIATPLVYTECQKLFGDATGFRVSFFLVAGAYALLACILQNFKTPVEEEEGVGEGTSSGDDAGVNLVWDALVGDTLDAGDGVVRNSADENFSFWNGDDDGLTDSNLPTRTSRSPTRRRLFSADDPYDSDDSYDQETGDDYARLVSEKNATSLPYPPLQTLLPMTAYMLLSVSSEVTYGSWIYTIAVEHTGFSTHNAAYLTSSFWATFTATRFGLALGGVRPLTAIVFSHAVTFIATAALAVVWWGGLDLVGTWHDNPPTSKILLWVITLLTGTGTAGMFPNGIALGRNFFPLEGFAQACFELGASVGSGIGPLLGSTLFQATQKYAAIPASCAVSGVGAVVCLCVALGNDKNMKKRQTRTVDDSENTLANIDTVTGNEPALGTPLLRSDGDDVYG